MFIEITNKTTTTPLSAARLREWLRTDESEDSLIRRLALSAANRFEKYTSGRSILNHTYTVYYNIDDLQRNTKGSSAGDVLTLFHKPVTSIIDISWFDDDNLESTLVANTDYHFIAGDHTVRFDNDFVLARPLRDHNAFKLVYVAGYLVVPDDVINGLELYAAYLYEHRGDEAVEMPTQIAEYWDPYVIHRFGSPS